MAEPMWFKPPYPCTKCDKDITIMRVSINSNSQVLLEGICVTCGLESHGTITFNRKLIKELINLEMICEFESLEDDRDEQSA